MALKGVVSGVAILSAVLLSSCGAYRLNNEETDREYLKRELDELEYEMEVKSLYSELLSLFNGISTTKYPTTMAPTTMAPTTPKSSANDNYIQHIVNCFKSYRYATTHGLSERDYIYNIVVVQCMSDPKVDRLVKMLTAYHKLINEDTKKYDAYDVVEWLFEIFNDEKENKGEESDSKEETESKEETDVKVETTTIIEPNPTTPESEPTTSEHELTTSVPNQTTDGPRWTTAEVQQTNAKVVTTSSFTNEIEDNDEEAVKELLLQRVLMLLKKEKIEGKASTLR
ncbi:uncharacterized protein LOC117106265 [Anneissia japonica]|uniref:uncharacterized protein LOC117106265 n=1 Tax=Anneissia japonica TaxID=1529436 RepID=UPI001425770D|nr:uncharacterized protein LOC117106265 [Anneissia japonica]